jgi:glyoxylase-like metal-dependent hydrolase (beta-lactamase superfamily II)
MEIINFTLGPLENNTYLAADPLSGKAIVIDPAFEPGPVLEFAAQKGWTIEAIWLTHAHFDHIAGCAEILKRTRSDLPVALHPEDLPLWHEKGGARMFGFQIDPLPSPSLNLAHGQILRVGAESVEVRHTPGHSPGHVVFYCASAQAVLCGDLIFYRSVGRTDLPGASSTQLAASIRSQIYSLPRGTRLLPGHGPETTVGGEQGENPYV